MSAPVEQQSNSPLPGEGAPGSAGPSPLMIGKRFVKQYYQVLSSTPDQIFRFYQQTSFLSHAEGSTPTDPSTFESYDIAQRWGEASKKRFEFEHGAIDAQPSVNGSILVIVTGHVVFVTEDGEDRKAFVHTFFLSLLGQSKRFYVHNDVLRFLTKEATKPTSLITESETEEAPVDPAQSEPQPVEKKQLMEEEAPGGGVEESKEVAPEEEEEAAPGAEEKVFEAVSGDMSVVAEEVIREMVEELPVVEAKEPKDTGKGKKQKGRGRSPPQQSASKSVPGSWASLVASGGGKPPMSSSAASSQAKAPAPAKADASAETKPDPTPQQEKNSSKDNTGGKQKQKRDPDCTLVIKNLADNTKDSELLALFEPFAIQTKGKIVSSTISNNRGLAFVDYDSVAPVLAAVEQHAKEPLQLGGRVLEVDQKTAEQRARRNRGGYRSGSPANGGIRGSGGSGRHGQSRRGGSRSSDKGGGKGNRNSK